jgi:hypothetical protein
MKKTMSAPAGNVFPLRNILKVFPLALSVILIGMMYSSFTFARPGMVYSTDIPPVAPPATPASVYDSLHLADAGLNREAFTCAQKGWQKLVSQGRISNSSVIAIVDFSQPSSHKRLYIIDMDNYRVLFNTLVAHGRNSGTEWASSFSNEPSSYKSSAGFYVTGNTYTGGNGYSLKLTGVEKGINDNALERAIVVHGADYVSPSAIGTRGYIGRSFGCPAVPREYADGIINTIKNGACLFIYTPGGQYVSRSAILTDSFS